MVLAEALQRNNSRIVKTPSRGGVHKLKLISMRSLRTGLAYVIGVVIVWAVILCAAKFLGGGVHFKGLLSLCLIFFAGMLSMYIAQHVYPRF